MEQTMSEIASSSSTVTHQCKENEIKKRPFPDDISLGCQEGSGTVQSAQETMLSHESPKKKRRNCNSCDEPNCFPDDIVLCKETCIDGDSPHSAVTDTDTAADGSGSTLIEESMQKCQTEKIETVEGELTKQLLLEEYDQKPTAKLSSSSTKCLPNSSIITTLAGSTDSYVSGFTNNMVGTTSGQDLPRDRHSDNLLKDSECFGNGSTINNVTDTAPSLIDAACCQEDKTSASSSANQFHMCSEKGNVKKKLLILDVNGLLADILPDPEPGYVVDTWFAMKAVFKRTFCNDFLQFCFDNFNVGIWSSRNRRNVESIVDFLMGEKKKKLLFCWNQAHCTNTGYRIPWDKHKPLFFKEIKKLWDKEDPDLPWEKGDYDESNTLLMDDSPHKALRNPLYTGIFPRPYVYKDNTDTLLGPKGELRLYLKRLAMAEHVQTFVAANPYGQRPITERDAYWPYYSKILNPTCSREPEKKGDDDRLDEQKTIINDAKQEPGKKASSEPEKKGNDDRPDEPKPDIKVAKQDPGKNSPSEPEKKGDDDRLDEAKSDINDAKHEEPGQNGPSEPEKKGDDDRLDEPDAIQESEKKGNDDSPDEPKNDIKLDPPREASTSEVNDIKLDPPREASTSEVATRVATAEDPMGSPD